MTTREKLIQDGVLKPADDVVKLPQRPRLVVADAKATKARRAEAQLSDTPTVRALRILRRA